MLLLQLSDPHLLADPQGLCRDRNPLHWFRHGLHQALQQVRRQEGRDPDGLVITGDLCQDESWGGYVHLRDCLAALALPVALLPGNHDQPMLLGAVLGRHAWVAPASVGVGGGVGPWRLLLLSTHRHGDLGGWIVPQQQRWLELELADGAGPVLVALHHPPCPIGSPALDAMALQDPDPLTEVLLASPRVRGIIFGHVHQHWSGQLSRGAGRGWLPLWGCPSTLAAFTAVQPCPLGRAGDPGGRLLRLDSDGRLSQRLLRWGSPPAGPAHGQPTS